MLGSPVRLGKRRCHDDGEDNGSVSVYFHGIAAILTTFELAPRHSLVRPRAAIGPVKLLAGIDVHAKIGAIAEQHSVSDLVLAHTTTKDNDAGLFRLDTNIIEATNITHDVNGQSRVFVGMEIDHIAQ